MKKLLLTGILLMSILATLAGCGGGKGSTGPVVATVTTIAGSAGMNGTTDATGTDARFYLPIGVAVNGSGNLYVTDTYNHTIRKLTKSGITYTVTTIAGLANNLGFTDGTGTVARFHNPEGIAVDDSGNLYVADTENCTIRKLTWSESAYTVSTVAGLAITPDSTDAIGTAARFRYPAGITVDGSGNLYVADTVNHTIRKLTWNDPDYTVSTIAGTVSSMGIADGDGLTEARFNYPFGIAVDGNGNLYVADKGNHTIRKLTKSGSVYTVTTIAGLANNFGFTDGIGTEARFKSPKGITVDSSGNHLYVADTVNNTIRKLTKSGSVYTVTTIAGLAEDPPGSTDGTGTAARFETPYGITIDGSGNLFVVDQNNDTIRKITFN